MSLTMTKEERDGARPAGGVLVHGSALTARQNRELLAEVALKHRLPTMFGVRETWWRAA